MQTGYSDSVCETKLEKKDEVMFGRMKKGISGVRTRERGKQEVGIIMRDQLWKCVKECK